MHYHGNIILVLVFILFTTALYGQEEQEETKDDSVFLIIRPAGSIGYCKANDMKGLSYSYGIRILLLSNEFQRYGYIIDHKQSYLCMGIYLEQILFKHFNMGIGTVGYINTVNWGENPFGLYTHLGFEYYFNKWLGVVANYRSDFIFRKSFTSNNAFSLEIGFKL